MKPAAAAQFNPFHSPPPDLMIRAILQVERRDLSG
jgi:hypothetical protein